MRQDIDRDEYPFESRWLDTPHGRIHHVVAGAGEPILFVHGTPTWSFEWRHVVRTLSKRYRCIALDHLGFGLSDRPREFAYTPEAHAENLAFFVDARSGSNPNTNVRSLDAARIRGLVPTVRSRLQFFP